MSDEVVDCSVVVKLFVPEEGTDSAVEWSKRWRNGKINIWAPELIIAEFANVIWYKIVRKEISRKIGRESIADFLKLPINTVSHESLVEASFKLACENNITVYDALYCALSYKLRCPLTTADRKLANSMKSTAIVTKII